MRWEMKMEVAIFRKSAQTLSSYIRSLGGIDLQNGLI